MHAEHSALPRRCSLAALLALAACGVRSPDANDPDASVNDADAGPSQAPAAGTFQSGTRLRAHLLEGDGAALFRGWHDTVLGVDCAFQARDDGAARCVPHPDATLYADPASFLDASCTQPAWTGQTPTQTLYLWRADNGCDPTAQHVTRVYTVRSTAAATTALYTLDGGHCVGSSAPAGQGVFALEQADEGAFAAARVVTEPRGAALDVQVLVTDDGARQLGAISAHTRQLRCNGPRDTSPSPYFQSDQFSGRCVPTPLALAADAFSDAACSVSVAGAYWCQPACPVPAFALREPSTPGAQGSVYSVNSADIEAYVPGDATACVRSAGVGMCSFHAVGGEVALESFPALALARRSTGRLGQGLLYATDDARPLAEDRSRLWDSARGAYCGDAAFADGTHRCVTEGGATTNSFGRRLFADAGCTAVVVSGNGAAPPAFATEPLVVGNAIYVGITRAVYAVGARVSPPIYQAQTDGTCAVNDRVADQSFYLVGAALDPDALFTRLVDRVE